MLHQPVKGLRYTFIWNLEDTVTAFMTISIDNDFVFRYHNRHLEARRAVKVPKGSLGHNGITKHNLGTEGYKN